MLLNVHAKMHLNKKSSLKDFRLPEPSEKLLLFWLTTNTAPAISFTLSGAF